VWHAATKELRRQDKVEVVAIVQDQHPDRDRLFLQWKQVDWPVLADPLNLLNLETVPITLAIDEYGIVRFTELPMSAAKTIERTFLNQTYAPSKAPVQARPDLHALAGVPRRSAADALDYGDAVAVWGGAVQISESIEAYRQAVRLEPNNARAHFRLGSALRQRYDSPARRAADFQDAVTEWDRALELEPNRYIWRRRAQQYGPRPETPYDLFDWIPKARAEIAARGDTPLPLLVEPGESELTSAVATASSANGNPTKPHEPDPQGRLKRDRGEFIALDAAVAPLNVKPGTDARVHLAFRPNLEHKAHWNNSVEPLTVWLKLPPGWIADRAPIVVPNATTEVSQETRTAQFQVRIPGDARSGPAKLAGYATYYVCEDVRGVCVYRRRDIEIPLSVR
jgi:TPR repeat